MCSLINTIAFLMVCNLASMAGAVAVSDASQGHVFVLVEAFCIFLMVLVEAFMMRGGCIASWGNCWTGVIIGQEG